MNITVKYFASLRERQGTNEESLHLERAIPVAQVWQRVSGSAETGAICMAINMEYVKPGALVKDGDEVAFFPPVTGG